MSHVASPPDEDPFDLSAYDAAVVEHGLFGFARARVFETRRQGRVWHADLERGSLRIGEERYDAQLLGTFAPRSRTFRWAWANPSAVAWSTAIDTATRLRELASERGHAVFGAPTFQSGWVDARELVYVSGELAGGQPVFATESHGVTAFLVVTSPIDPRELPVDAFAELFTDFESFALVDLSACVSRFLERMGFAVRETVAVTSAHRASDGACITIDFQGDGRIASVQLGGEDGRVSSVELRR